MTIIPYGKQSIDQSDLDAVAQVLRSDFITTGPKIAEFEKAVADYTGAGYAVAVSSGTAALHIACLAAGIGERDEVITTPITFAASANCVLYCGGKPVFADIDPATYNIDPKEIARNITARTKAILPVDFAGQPCDMDEIRRIARQNGLLVIEDAAHALGAEYHGKKVGCLADMTTFSFHPVKSITTGEGGMVTTDSPKLCEKLRLFRAHGITRDPSQMEKDEGGWYYEQLALGYNYRITDFQCALGISQMKRLDRFLARRREIAKRYDEAFSRMKGIVIPAQAGGRLSSRHLYCIQVTGIPRKAAFDQLRSAGIGVNVHYIPVYRHPYYRNLGYRNVRCKNAENLYEKILSLPIYPELTEEQQGKVIEAVGGLRPPSGG